MKYLIVNEEYAGVWVTYYDDSARTIFDFNLPPQNTDSIIQSKRISILTDNNNQIIRLSIGFNVDYFLWEYLCFDEKRDKLLSLNTLKLDNYYNKDLKKEFTSGGNVGEYKTFYPSGIIKELGNYVPLRDEYKEIGVKDGQWLYYNEEGNLIKIGT